MKKALFKYTFSGP